MKVIADNGSKDEIMNTHNIFGTIVLQVVIENMRRSNVSGTFSNVSLRIAMGEGGVPLQKIGRSLLPLVSVSDHYAHISPEAKPSEQLPSSLSSVQLT